MNLASKVYGSDLRYLCCRAALQAPILRRDKHDHSVNPQQAEEVGIATLGPGLPNGLPKIAWWQMPLLLKRPRRRPLRIWHARRNNEMLIGLFLKAAFRAPLTLVFTSAAQRSHSWFSRFLISRMDSVIATSGPSGQSLAVPHTVVMHGVDCARFRPPVGPHDQWEHSGLPGRYAIGCFGRIRYLKGTIFSSTRWCVCCQIIRTGPLFWRGE